jgi:hypothetical protein
MHPIILYIAAATTGLWGLAHLFATKGVVAGFGRLTEDDRRILTMEWIVEGVALLSIAAFVVAVTLIEPAGTLSSAVYGVAIGTLIVLAIVSLFTGFRVNFIAFKLCPLIFCGSAALIAWGAWF